MTEEVYQTVREWVVARRGGQITGCGSLVILWADLAEVRSLVVAPEAQGLGIGRQLVTALVSQAGELEIPQVFALTRKTEFFLKLGFHVVPRETLPRKIWKDCVHCLKFVGCDEVAVVRAVDEFLTSPGQLWYNLKCQTSDNCKCSQAGPSVSGACLGSFEGSNGDTAVFPNRFSNR
jgi:amino-acid N-acetyltransferase